MKGDINMADTIKILKAIHDGLEWPLHRAAINEAIEAIKFYETIMSAWRCLQGEK